jgi:protein-disulfide isomerase
VTAIPEEAEIRRIAEEVARTQIASAALSSSSSSAGASDEEIQQLVDEAVGTQVAALRPTDTPIPPTPTIIPRGVAEDDDAFRGLENAAVVIVEFGDYQCGFCGRWYTETLPQILETYPEDVKFVYRDFVIFGDESLRAAAATECANEQDKFWDMHNRLYDRLNNREEAPLSDETFISYAEDLGMDTSAFSECLTSERYVEEILNDYRAAEAYGLRGTPGFVINGVVYPIGAQSFEVFDGIIQAELSRLQDAS